MQKRWLGNAGGALSSDTHRFDMEQRLLQDDPVGSIHDVVIVMQGKQRCVHVGEMASGHCDSCSILIPTK
jgi:hypothetical protein